MKWEWRWLLNGGKGGKGGRRRGEKRPGATDPIRPASAVSERVTKKQLNR
jgi:hypothetical protein